MTNEEIVIALLAITTVAGFVAWLFTYLRLKGFSDVGVFTPGKDCLQVTYYYIEAEEYKKYNRGGESRWDISNIPSINIKEVVDIYVIEGEDILVSAGSSAERVRPLSPPPVGYILIDIKIELIRDCVKSK